VGREDDRRQEEARQRRAEEDRRAADRRAERKLEYDKELRKICYSCQTLGALSPGWLCAACLQREKKERESATSPAGEAVAREYGGHRANDLLNRLRYTSS
jgi:hypothetical protein